MISGPSSEQSFPPYWGAGLVQFLVLFITPPPQVTLQAVHADHSVYPPFTTTTHQWEVRVSNVFKKQQQGNAGVFKFVQMLHLQYANVAVFQIRK